MDVKIISVIIGVLLGGAVSSLGFYFKNRRDTREKINESLFQLLEIWSLMAMVKVISSENFHSLMLEEIKKKFPHENIGDNEKALLKEGMAKALPMLTGMEVGLDGRFLTRYKSSVNELAKIYPLMAFDLNSNQILIRFLGSIDKLVEGSEVSDEEERMLDNMREFMLEESFNELESDLIKLSSASGFWNKRRTRIHVDRIRNRLKTIPSDIFDEYINKVIGPAIQAHYDNLGVENPNKTIQSASIVGA